VRSIFNMVWIAPLPAALVPLLFLAASLASAQRRLNNNPSGISFPPGYRVTNASAPGCDCVNMNVTGLCPPPRPPGPAPSFPMPHNPCSDLGPGVTVSEFRRCFQLMESILFAAAICVDASLPLIVPYLPLPVINLTQAQCDQLQACDAVFVNESCILNDLLRKIIMPPRIEGAGRCGGANPYTIPKFSVSPFFARLECTKLIYQREDVDKWCGPWQGPPPTLPPSGGGKTMKFALQKGNYSEGCVAPCKCPIVKWDAKNGELWLGGSSGAPGFERIERFEYTAGDGRTLRGVGTLAMVADAYLAVFELYQLGNPNNVTTYVGHVRLTGGMAVIDGSTSGSCKVQTFRATFRAR